MIQLEFPFMRDKPKKRVYDPTALFVRNYVTPEVRQVTPTQLADCWTGPFERWYPNGK